MKQKKQSRIFGFIAPVNRYIAAHTLLVAAVCLALMVLVSVLKFTVYPENTFYDANEVRECAQSGDVSGQDLSFRVTIRFFTLLGRLFGSELSLQQWGWILLVPGAAVFLFILYRAKPENVGAFFVLAGFSVFLPMFVFTTGKDFLQYLLFFLMAVLLLRLPKNYLKVFAVCVLSAVTALCFRQYYWLMFGFVPLIYVFALLYRRQTTPEKQAIFLLGTAILAVAGLYLLRWLFPYYADVLFTVRTVTNSAAGRTALDDKIILDPLQLEKSVPGFLGNYLIAALRMMIPVELCAGISDIPFVLFQIVILLLFVTELIKSRRIRGRTVIYAAAISFFLMSFFFEPDFGSWFRHEAAAFPILWLALGSGSDAKPSSSSKV